MALCDVFVCGAGSGGASQRPSKSPRPTPSDPSASPSPAAATATTAGDATGRAAAELAQFQDRHFGDDVDPDAPAAMKDSPSVSGGDGAGELHCSGRIMDFSWPDFRSSWAIM